MSGGPRAAFFTMFAISVILALSGDIQAQEAMPIKPGDRVRVTAPEYSRDLRPIGTVISFDADSLVVKVVGYRDPIAVPLAVLTQLEVFRAKRQIGKNALKGLGYGAAVGGLTGLIAGAEDDFVGPLYVAVFGAGFLGSIGLVLGALGALTGVIQSDYDWEDVPLDQIRVGILPKPGGGLAFSVSLAL